LPGVSDHKGDEMSTLDDILVEKIPGSTNEWQIIFKFGDTEERLTFYRGETVRTVLYALLKFVTKLL
jgi:hypothetical protein